MTVSQYQHLFQLQAANTDVVERLAYSVCYLYNLDEEKVNAMSAARFTKLCKRFDKSMNIRPYRFARKRFTVQADQITLGQFIECQAWLTAERKAPMSNVHNIAASILKRRGEHKQDAIAALDLNIRIVFPSVMTFMQSFSELLLKYKWLFDSDSTEDVAEKPHPFISNFGWVFSAAQVATHLGVTVNEAYSTNIIEALNTLTYLKAKGQYDNHLMKQK